ncbi:MAG: hypothetical protein QOF09_2665 [Alphaproteobacteria bacterium]|nr:hypothetical protein [Alphaproteobacteria bacterium]
MTGYGICGAGVHDGSGRAFIPDPKARATDWGELHLIHQ